MRGFADTSALLAVLDASDRCHAAARAEWDDLLEAATDLVTTSCVLVECYALVQRRLGMEAVRALQSDIEPVLEILWVDPALR
ncbi:PIN domain-containing protein [Limnochorda pilosa]|uniref:Twitching motility protein PilT n=1 Tax=Limnochorda pilosa TaxID=1555112 RepID=A0A0K2SM12_LIMPI|nr:twitching motility protein PilT [Limnochorda pilosa]